MDVYALQKAYIAAGGNCKDGKYWGSVAYAEGTIECDHDTMIDVFEDRSHMADYQAKDRAEGYSQTLLAGDNWQIRTDKAEIPAIQAKMGGRIVSYTANK